MKKNIHLWAWLLAVLLLGAGCGGGNEPPKAVPLAEIPTRATNLFATAAPPVRQMLEQGLQALRKKDTPRAWSLFQQLSARPELSEKQRTFVAGCVMTLSEEMNRAVESGNAEAVRLRKAYGSSK
jgi:hypothetical protein